MKVEKIKENKIKKWFDYLTIVGFKNHVFNHFFPLNSLNLKNVKPCIFTSKKEFEDVIILKANSDIRKEDLDGFNEVVQKSKIV